MDLSLLEPDAVETAVKQWRSVHESVRAKLAAAPANIFEDVFREAMEHLSDGRRATDLANSFHDQSYVAFKDIQSERRKGQVNLARTRRVESMKIFKKFEEHLPSVLMDVLIGDMQTDQRVDNKAYVVCEGRCLQMDPYKAVLWDKKGPAAQSFEQIIRTKFASTFEGAKERIQKFLDDTTAARGTNLRVKWTPEKDSATSLGFVIGGPMSAIRGRIRCDSGSHVRDSLSDECDSRSDELRFVLRFATNAGRG